MSVTWVERVSPEDNHLASGMAFQSEGLEGTVTAAA